MRHSLWTSILYSESVLGKLGVDLGNLLVSHGLGLGGNFLLLSLEELLRLNLSLLFKSINNVFLGPANLSGEISENASLSSSFNSKNFEGLWDDHSLLGVIWEWDTLEDLELLESSSTLG